MLKKFLIGTFVALALLVGATASAAYDFGTTTLKVGSTGEAVKNVQTVVGATPVDGIFGAITKAKVMVWQAANGLTADGLFGNLSKAKANGTVVAATPGCPAGALFNSLTGAACTTATTLTGAAGDVDSVDQVTTSVKSEVLEGASGTKILGFDVTADNGSDLVVSSLRLEFENQATATASTHLDRYIEDISVYVGSTKVGSVSTDDFSETNDVYSKSISLSNVVVKAGETVRMYVAVDAASTIDTNDQVPLDWGVELISLRVQDASGAILTFDPGSTAGTGQTGVFETLGFADLAGSGDLALRITKDSTSPSVGSIEADANSETDATMLVFKIKAEGSDMTVDSLTLDLTQTTPGAAVLADLISEVKLMKGTDELDSVTAANFVAAGVGLADQVVFTDLDDDLVIEDGDTVTLKVVATINAIAAPLANGETLVVSLTAADTAMASMDVEDADGDQVGDGTGGTSDDRTGSAVGSVQTFEVDVPTVALVSKSLALFQAIDGIAAGEEDIFLAKFVFNVTAAGDDIYLTKGIEGDATYTTAADTIQSTQTGAGAVNSAVIEADDETLDDGLTSSFLVAAGTTEKFTVSYYVVANDEAEKFVIDSIAYGAADDAAATYDYNSVITSNLTSFATPSVYLAK